MTGPSIAGAVREAAARLHETSETPDLDARLLARDAFGLDAAGLVMMGLQSAEPDALRRFRAMVERRASGEPVHRILGRRGFYEHEFELSPETLEPRPDTEILVELAAKAIRMRGKPDLTFADLGTGSGAIAVSLLALFPQSRCVAVDLSKGALATARRNAVSAGVGSRFEAATGDMLDAVDGPLDMLVSNPPYIPTSEIERLSPDVRRHDPMLALDGGADGLDAYRTIADQLRRRPDRIGDVLLEIGAGQGPDVEAIFAQSGYVLRETGADLLGHMRALWFCDSPA